MRSGASAGTAFHISGDKETKLSSGVWELALCGL
jgi:hypothetical protein